MKTYTNLFMKIFVVICFCIFSITNLFSQVNVPFTQRTAAATPGQTIYSIKGDFTLIGNTNYTLQNYSNTANNSNNIMIEVDVDGNAFPTTTNSSSATLAFSQENGALPECSNVIFAGLYWTGRTNNATVSLAKRSVKFRHASQTNYQDIVANVNDIYFPGDDNMYAAYAEVTDIVRTNGLGEYFTGNVEASVGNGGATGYYGGWAMVVVYDNPLMKWRDVTVFDGYAYVVGQVASNILQVNGFNAIQNGPVNMKLGLVAGEGDVSIAGDYFEVRNAANTAWIPLAHTGNSTGNFFNSSIQTGGNARNPNLLNNTGLDISMFNINNNGNSIIANSQTSTSFRYGSTQDTYIIFNIAMAIDAFVPSIDGEISVTSIDGDATVSEPYTINPGEIIEYNVDIANNGTEDLTNFTITIPFPDTGDFVPGSIQYQSFAPANPTTVPYYDATFGSNGALIWQFGNLPISSPPSNLLATLSFQLQASNSCEDLTPANCMPTITLNNAVMTGTGAISQDFIGIFFNQGHETIGNCIGNPITDPIVVSVIPKLEIDVNAVDLTVQCDGNGNITDLNNWLDTNASADVIGTCTISWTNNFSSISDDCGETGSATVTFTAEDDCGNTASTTATFTIIDDTPPDLSNCTTENETLECNGTDNETIADAWNTANITELETCPGDDCDADATYSVTSDYDFANLDTTGACGNGGSITVTYTATDDCNNSSSVTATLTLEDSTPPDLTICSGVTNETLECNGTDNETIADAWNAANITELETCPGDDCDLDATYSVTSDYDFANLDTTGACGNGGAIPVTYTVEDDCGNQETITVTLTLEDSTPPDLTICTGVTNETLECNGTDNETIADAWNTANITELETCPGDDCDADATYSVTSDYDFANLDTTGACGNGGAIPVTYTVEDDCGNQATITVTLTLEDSTPPDLTICTGVTNETLECNGTDNETIADAWNTANITELETCPGDDCDLDATYSVTSDYDFANLDTTGACGNGGAIPVTYTVEDDCGNQATITVTLTLEDSTPPDLTICSGVTNETLECTATDNETIADAWNAANIAELETCPGDDCDADATYSVTSNYDFANLSVVCGPCGTLPVTYTVEDDCGNQATITVTLNFGDATGPELANCNVVNETIECNGTLNEDIADAWNADNITELEACADDINVNIDSDYDYTNFDTTGACGAGGSITVTYTATDDCNNSSSVTATLTLEDSTPPDLTICTGVTNETLECNGTDNETIADAWNATNITELETCPGDDCDLDATYSVTSDYDFANLDTTGACGNGGAIPVTYTVEDDCGNQATITVTLTLEDSTPPDLTICSGVTNETLECNGTDNETIADAWNAANITELETCPGDDCDADATYSVTSDYDFANLDTTGACGAGGSITVTYTATDDCGNQATITVTLTLEDSTPPDLTICTGVTNETLECNGTDNETIADAWNTANITELETCPGDDCDLDATYSVTSDYDFANLDTTGACGNGGAIPVTYTVEDDCGNQATITVTLTLEDSTPPDLTICSGVTNETLECTATDNETIADAWNAANIAELETCPGDDCDADATYSVTSNYDFANLSVVCGPCGTLPVTYTVEDDCGNQATITVTLNFGDATGPELANCNVVNETIECNGTLNEDIADAWNADNITELEACADDINVNIDSDYDYTNFDTTGACGAGGSITVTYTATDDCNNSSSVTATLTLEDSTPPDLTICSGVTNETLECNGTDNETIADAWNTANITELETCPGDDCDLDATYSVTSDYDFANLDTTGACGAGGSITVTYTATDDCNNSSSVTATLTLEDSTPPDLTICSGVTNETLECNGTDNETIADAWNTANITELETCPGDDCDADATYSVTSDYDFANLDTTGACGNGGAIPVTYTVEDDCGNQATITVTLTLEDSTPPDLTICSGVTNETLECTATDNETIADAWNVANITELETCPGDDCDADATYSVTSNYDFANLSVVCGPCGTLPVTYTVEDDCGNQATITVTLNFGDATGPELANCNVVNETIECNGTLNEDIADAWNADNITELEACADDINVNIDSDYDYTNFDTTGACGAGGSITVTYTATDDCNNSSSVTATLTLEDSTPPDLTICSGVTNETLECNGTDNETIADAWNTANITELETCPGDDCDLDATYSVTSDYDFANLDTTGACGNGGAIPVTYTVEDDCGNQETITVTLTLEDSTPPDLTICSGVTNETLECNGTDNETIADAWNTANITELETCPGDDCDADATYSVTSDYDFANLDTTGACGNGGAIPVTYTVEDDCGNQATITVTLTLEDSTPPDLTICSGVTNETLECNGTDNETIADAWNTANITELETCPGDDCDLDATYSVTSDYDFANLDTTGACGNGGAIPVTYTVEDDCGNQATITVTLTLEDSTPPDLTICSGVTNETLECTATDNETIADAWNAANIAELETCPGDDCDADATYSVTSNYDFANLSVVCGPCGTLPVTYTVEDDCGNQATITVTLNFGDATGPELANCNVVNETIECNGTLNEDIADAWNADNITELEACADDINVNIDSDYDYTNFDTTGACGAGGSITVTYTATDDCNNSSSVTATLTLEDSTPPDLTICTGVTNETLECNGTDNETIADAWNAANITELETCPGDDCDLDATYSVTSDYDFANLDTTGACGNGGAIPVTYTVEDDCGNQETITVTLTLEDSTPPDLTICTGVTNETLECNGTDNETIADAWNAANITELETCPGDDCDLDATYSVTSDYDFANLDTTGACGNGGAIPVTYTVEDDCGNQETITVTLTLEDSTPPDLTICTGVTNETLECNGTDNETIADAWNAANITELETCPSDDCDLDATYSVTSDYDFANLDTTGACGNGGAIPVTYTVEDDCGNQETITVTLTLEDSTPPDLTICTGVTNETLECNGTDNETIADAWNAANITELETCPGDDCDADATYSVTSDYDFANLDTTGACGNGGAIPVTYTVEDDCGNQETITVTLTLEDSTPPDLTICTGVTNETLECNGTDNETIADAWNAANITELETCPGDDCDLDATYSVTSDYDFANLDTTGACGNGGAIPVTYTVEDDCGNQETITVTLTLEDSTPPDLTICTGVTNETLECTATDNETIADAWNAANIAELETCPGDDCDADATYSVTSDYDFANLSVVCGPCGTLPVTYTVEDDCGNQATITVTLNFGDATGPELANCNVVNETIECNGTLNETIADAWNADNITELETCADDINVNIDSDYDYTNFDTTGACGAGGSITVTYTATDDCNNSSSVTATLTLEDSTPPDLTICTGVTNETLECNGTDNETIADAWNAANITELETCPGDDCDLDATYSVTSDYDFANLDTTGACGNGGAIPVTYTVEDDCGNQETITVTLTLEDSTPPDLTICTGVTNETLECNGTDNETIADAWNAANITELETCPGDDCDADATYSVTSDYDFANLDTTGACGNGGAIPVTYTVEDDCGNQETITVTLTLEDSTPPDLTICTGVTNETLECNGTDNETIADAWNAANITELETCPGDDCDLDATYSVTSDYDFANLDTTGACGNGGAIPVTYTVEDDCGNQETITVTLTLEDSTPPDLTICTGVTNETLECNGTDNETIADAWNAANITELETCPGDDCDADATYSVTSDYDFANLDTTGACGNGGAIPVTYTVEDDCGNQETITVTLTLEDSTPPDLTICTGVTNETLECNGTDNETIADAWNAANITELETCPGDDCDLDATYSVTSDYDFANLDTTGACGNGGAIPVTYTVEDDCGNQETITVTLTLEDSTPPDLTICTGVTNETLECNGTDNETIADAWNAANITELETCPGDDCDLDATYSVTSDYDFANLDTTGACGNGGAIPVTYTVEDDCGNQETITVTLTLEDSTPPDLTICTGVTNETLECNGTDNETIADAWNAANITELETCPGDDCDLDATYSVTSDYDFANLDTTGACGNGGAIPVTYTVEDDCGNQETITVTLTLEDSTPPDLTICTGVTNETLECNGTDNETIADAWNAANITELETCPGDDCDADATYSVTSDYDFANLDTTGACGNGGAIPVTYTVEDDCGNQETITVTLTLEDSTPPDLTICSGVTNETLECNGTDNETIADAWNAANITELETCPGDDCDLDATYSVTSDYDFANLDTTGACGNGGAIPVTYTVEDDCGNQETITVTLTLEDSTPPDLTICTGVTNETLECNGTDNETIADAWNAANITELETCPGDDCDLDATYSVTSDYDFANLDTTGACGVGGSITVIYSVEDDCGNSASITTILTLEDSTPPDLSGCAVTDQTLDCDGTDNEAIADQWNADNIAALEACAADSCDADFTGQVTSDYDFANLTSAPGLGGMLDVEYIITDDCGNETSLFAMLTLQNNSAIATDIILCVAEETEAQIFDLFDLISGNYDDSGTWQVISGDAVIIDGHYFDPLSIELVGVDAAVEITFSYIENDSACPTDIEAIIEVNNICRVENCTIDDVVISKAVTPNGDQYNEFFEITNVELCNFTYVVKIFNRWGALIYASKDYQNNWSGVAHNNSIGGSNTVPDGTYYYIVTLIDKVANPPVALEPINGYIYVGTK